MRTRFLAGTISLLSLAAVVTVGATAGTAASDKSEKDLIRKGFKLAPVELKFKKKNRDLVGLGSYIVNASGDCNGCHTNPSFDEGGDPFQGQPEKINKTNYLAGGQQFGPFTSRNITPDSSGRPAGLTYAQFLHTLRTGEDPDNPGGLLQVMPWPAYGKMTEHHIRAVYQYLRAIPHADPLPPPG